jgi:succinoglycan biosynthesis protein ExoL
MSDVLVFFGQERMDARAIKRIHALRDQGWQILGFTFHRDHGQPMAEATWENIHLGTTYSRRYLQRAFAMLKGVGLIWKHRARLREARAIYTINADNALLAIFARWCSGKRLPLAVEIADIQPAMTRASATGRVLRAIERWVLRRTSMLITTSPGFIRHYFEPIQQFRGRVFLLENKVYPSTALRASREPSLQPRAGGQPWVIGYFGAFRCERSLELIAALARALPETVRFVLRGIPNAVDPAAFHQLVAAIPNLEYGGPYAYPADLPSLYAAVDLNWCFDFSVAGENSRWLLPNRIYEGGLMHCPALVAAGTETATWVMSRQLGWAFGDDLGGELRTFFESLTPEAWHDVQARCLRAPDDAFAGESDYVALSEALRTA